MPSVSLNVGHIPDTARLHRQLQQIFGFPDFYGANYAALVDCWSSLRYPEDGMSRLVLAREEMLEIRVRGLSTAVAEVRETLISAVEDVNQRQISHGLPPSLMIVSVD